MSEELEDAAYKIIKENTLYGSPEAEIGSDARSRFETELIAFKLGAKWQAERMFSKDEVFFFAGYCKGVLDRFPEKEPTDIFEDWLNILNQKL